MNFTTMIKKTLCAFILFVTITVSDAQIGDACTLGVTGDKGRCKLSSDCPVAKEQAKSGISPTLCGFYELTIPIVCCAEDIYSNEPNENTFLSKDSVYFPESDTQVSSKNKLRVSEKQCEKYSQSITEVVHAIPLVTHSETISITVEKCDYNSVPLIVGGQPATAGEFPFMAAIGFNTTDNKWRCGGTLISDKFVLSAAHCTYTRDAGEPTVVRLGDLVLSKSNDGSQHKDYKIRRIIVHPDYKHPWKYNDIALLETERTILFTKFIRPACLHTDSEIRQDAGIATGWGKTDFAADNSDILMKVPLKFYDNQQCSKLYKTGRDLPQGITSTMLCAGELEGGKDTCQGDSGGPLLITKLGNLCKFYVVGITSFGKSCGQVNTTAVYTKVSKYVSWIEKNVW